MKLNLKSSLFGKKQCPACRPGWDYGEYITEQAFKEHYEFAFNLMNMMVAFKEKVK